MNFIDLLPSFATAVKSKVYQNGFTVNSSLGKGSFWAEAVPMGITILVSDTTLNQEVVIERPASDEQYFLLQFDEETEIETEQPVKQRHQADEFLSQVKLTQTLTVESFVYPAGKRLKSVKFLFGVDHLKSLLGEYSIDEVAGRYFPAAVKSENIEPVATEYRIMLDDLWSGPIDQPLRLNFIQNRILLLLEKFILKLHDRRDIVNQKVVRHDDETLRLMKVEALLVKNFAIAPPTIDELSRISAMSATKLKGVFKNLYGLPIYEYYQKNRMLKAKSLLLQDKFTIKEVGMMVGYSNLSHFAVAFKKQFNHLPSEIDTKDGMLVYGDR